MDCANVTKIPTPPSAKHYFPSWRACAVQTISRLEMASYRKPLLTSQSVMEMCFSCFMNTKYKWLKCELPIWNKCSVFESSLSCSQTTNYPGTKLVGVPFKLRKRMKNSLSCVHVLLKTLNFVVSRCCFAEDDKEMHQNVKRTCRGIVFAH